MAELTSERNYYLFAHELLDFIPFQKSLMAIVYLIISLVYCSA